MLILLVRAYPKEVLFERFSALLRRARWCGVCGAGWVWGDSVCARCGAPSPTAPYTLRLRQPVMFLYLCSLGLSHPLLAVSALSHLLLLEPSAAQCLVLSPVPPANSRLRGARCTCTPSTLLVWKHACNPPRSAAGGASQATPVGDIERAWKGAPPRLRRLAARGAR